MLKTNSCGIITNHFTVAPDTEGQSNYSTEIRQLKRLTNLTTLTNIHNNMLQPNAISSRGSISLLERKDGLKRDTINKPPTTSFWTIFFTMSIILLTILTVVLYIFAAWLWRGAKEFGLRNQTIQEMEQASIRDNEN